VTSFGGQNIDKFIWMMPVFVGYFMSHAFKVVAIHVIYARFMRPLEQAMFRNTCWAFYGIKHKYGYSGFLRGIVPSAILTHAFFRDDLDDLFLE